MNPDEFEKRKQKQKSELSVQILKEEMAKPTLTKEQILFFLHKFRSLNPKLLDHRRRLIDSFVNAIYLYDDRMIITFNYKEGTKTITFADIENAVNSSDMHSLGAPTKSGCRKSGQFFQSFVTVQQKILHPTLGRKIFLLYCHNDF